MDHHTPLIGTIVAGLVIAFVLGALAHRLRMSPLVGYLAAGIMVGPFTPGFVADGNLAAELAEIGVILLMFGVGLHFSWRDLASVKNIAVPGALVQIAAATGLGWGLAWYLGWAPTAGFVFGLALSVASTVVLLRALQARDLVPTERGRIAVGWLIVEDLAMVLALVLLPVVAGIANGDANQTFGTITVALGITFAKVVGFALAMLVLGSRVLPWLLHWAAHTGSRELFRLAVLAIALGVAFGAAVAFDVSFALGAFFAGMILGETPLSKRAAEETLPLRDAFAVLFFVSVGMLFDPMTIVEQPLPLIATVLIIVIGKSVAAFAIVRMFGHPNRTALVVSASLAQIGEFSFILAALGVQLDLLPAEGRDLILGGAILSILINPLIFAVVLGKGSGRGEEGDATLPETLPERLAKTVLVGYGRVGRRFVAGYGGNRDELTLIEDQGDIAAEAEEQGLRVIRGDASDAKLLARAGIDRAGTLVIAIPEGFAGGAIAERARAINPDLTIIARAHSDAEADHLTRHGCAHVVCGETEIAISMLARLEKGAPA